MTQTQAKRRRLEKRHRHVRQRLRGSAERPRLCVKRSLSQMYALVVDDDKGHTLVASSTLDKEVRDGLTGLGNCEAARRVGAIVAQRALAAGIKRVVFDRGGYLYHGRVKAVAEGAREAGLEF